MGDNYKNTIIGHLKIFFSRTTGINSIKLGANYPWVKRIQIQIKGQVLFKGEIITKI
jgi:hypothetical protein